MDKRCWKSLGAHHRVLRSIIKGTELSSIYSMEETGLNNVWREFKDGIKESVERDESRKIKKQKENLNSRR